MDVVATKSGTKCIGPKQAARAFHASRFTKEGGRPLNLLVTIDFSTLGVTPDNANALFQEIWARVSRWWAYRRQKGDKIGAFSCYAVHEHPNDGPRHVHWFIHVPSTHRVNLENAIVSRVEKLSGLACLGRALHFRDVTEPGGVAKYTLKGVNPAYANHFHMNASDQGFISGRRLAISRSIGPAARERVGWKRKKVRAPRS